ncbi:MAG: hypothetical protein JWM98_1290 [Thermoleophilia bacterium]|nr:hypothetical protein [Thermoleophilia bacterium]
MQISTPARTADAQPLRVIVNIAGLAGPATGDRWSLHRADSVNVDATGARMSQSTYDPLWDGPYAQPAQPGDWNRTVAAADTSPALAQALDGLRASVASLDWSRTSPEMTAGPAYATLHATFAERPAGATQAWQERDGTWTAYARTSLDDLLADPTLAPVVVAARAALAVGRPATSGGRVAA